MAGVVDFQDEEQVKSFLENMEVECNYQCYREKDPDGKRCRRGLGTRGGPWRRGRAGWSRERPRRESGSGHAPGARRDGVKGTLTTLRVSGRLAFHEDSPRSPRGSAPPASTWRSAGKRNAGALGVEEGLRT